MRRRTSGVLRQKPHLPRWAPPRSLLPCPYSEVRRQIQVEQYLLQREKITFLLLAFTVLLALEISENKHWLMGEEMFYLIMHSIHFIHCYMASDLADSEKENLLPPLHGLLLPISSKVG